jgi:hypothetical protein
MNAGTITVDGAPGSSFELGKNVFFNVDGAQSGVLILRVEVEPILSGSMVQGSINFLRDNETQSFMPLLTIVLNGFDSNVQETGRIERGGLGGCRPMRQMGHLSGS